MRAGAANTRAESRRALIAVAAASPALVWLAWSAAAHRFVCDDAYISFRYARNLLEGHGLVFNPGEWVEGYTNFSWVLEVAALWAAGLDPATGSIVLSAAWTVVTVVATGALAWRLARPDLAVALFGSLVLVATERSMAVWATSGLETRQFSALVALALLAVTFEGTAAALATSLALALAELTRPEALLLFALVAGLRGFDVLRARRWAELVALPAPFATIVGAHLLWRHHTYGMWVPNTYVAKATEPWWDLGWPYLGCAAIEAGLYLIGPLALVGFARRAWLDRRLAWLAGPLCIGVFVPWLARLGGDHFEWRPLDWWWAPLSAGAAYGVVVIARRGWAAVLLLALILPYTRVVELEHDHLASRRDVDSKGSSHEPITRENAPEAFLVPGMGPLLDWYDPAMASVIHHFGAVRHWRHASFAERERERYGPYLPLREEVRRRLPPDLVWVRGSIGIAPFHVPDVVVVDLLGLTDATIAATPPPTGKRRMLAHERRPPSGYLEERGADPQIEPAAPDLATALRHTSVAVPLAPGVVMPISSKKHESVLPVFQRWSGPLPAFRVSEPNDPAADELRTDDGDWVGVGLLGAFDRSLDDWVVDGEAFATRAPRSTTEGLDHLKDRVGAGFVTSHLDVGGDTALGTLTSPRFVVPPGGLVSLRVGGGAGEGTGVRVLVGDRVVATFHGDGDDDLAYVWVDLAAEAGEEARVEIYDQDPADHVTADHVVVMARR